MHKVCVEPRKVQTLLLCCPDRIQVEETCELYLQFAAQHDETKKAELTKITIMAWTERTGDVKPLLPPEVKEGYLEHTKKNLL